jgi:hypothetical protein
MTVSIELSQRALAVRHASGDFADMIAALDASSTVDCVDCGRRLGGLLGSFRWGIVNGQGECAECGYPYVYYHRHEVELGETLVLKAWLPGVPIPEKEAGA